MWWKRTHLRAASRLEKELRAENVRTSEQARVEHREAVVRLRGEVDDGVDGLVGERLRREVEVGDVALHEHDPVLDIREARAVAGVGEEVVDDDVVVRVALEPVVDEVRADEAGSAGDEQSHGCEGYPSLVTTCN